MKNYLPIFAILLSINNSMARWLKPSEVSERFNYINIDMYINKDATFSEISEEEVEVLTESGRNSNTIRNISYNSDTTKIEILEAKTFLGNKEFIVDKSKIVFKDQKNASSGFDSTKIVSIAYPNVIIGSRLYLKYKTTVFKTAIDNFFSQTYSFGTRSFEKAGTINIVSEVPLFIEKIDPHKILTTKNNKKNNLYSYQIKLEKEALYKITEEIQGVISEKDLNIVSVSTHKDWGLVHQEYFDQYEKIINDNLPKEINEISK